MSSTAIQGYNSRYMSGLDGTGVDGGNNQSQLEQMLELLIEELQQILSGSDQNSDGGGGAGGIGGASAPPPFEAPPSYSSGGGAAGPSGVGGGGGDTLPGNVSGGDAAQAISQDLKSRYGLNDAQAAGVLGNLQQESGLKGDINQGGAEGAPSNNFADDNGNGWGLAQWGGTRKQGEIDYAHQHGLDPGSLEANIGFMNQELDTTYSKTISDIKNTSTPEDAALAWDKDYELASDPQMGNRNQYAEQFFKQGL
jgi:Phage tail lysozyme